MKADLLDKQLAFANAVAFDMYDDDDDDDDDIVWSPEKGK